MVGRDVKWSKQGPFSSFVNPFYIILIDDSYIVMYICKLNSLSFPFRLVGDRIA